MVQRETHDPFQIIQMLLTAAVESKLFFDVAVLIRMYRDLELGFQETYNI